MAPMEFVPSSWGTMVLRLSNLGIASQLVVMFVPSGTVRLADTQRPKLDLHTRRSPWRDDQP